MLINTVFAAFPDVSPRRNAQTAILIRNKKKRGIRHDSTIFGEKKTVFATVFDAGDNDGDTDDEVDY